MASHPDQPPVFGYELRWGHPGADNNVVPEPLSWQLGAYHVVDIAFFFRAWECFFLNQQVFDENNRPGRERLSDSMMRYVASFAWHSDPNANGASQPCWQPWSNRAGGPKVLVLDADHQEARVHMGTDEMVESEIRSRESELPAAARDALRLLPRLD